MTVHTALVVGGIAWNTMVYVDDFPAPRPQTVHRARYHDTIGSSGAGKALNLRHLGFDVTLWGLIGDDDPGARIRHELASAGVTLIGETDPEGSMRHINLMDSAGDRISIFGNTGSEWFPVEPQPIVALAAGADLATVTIINRCRQFLPGLSASDTPLWVDIHGHDGVDPHHREFIDAADYVTMSSVQMEDWRGFLEHLIERGLRGAVCTHGAEGASGITASEGWVDVPALPVDRIVDTNGAGDAFFAGFAAATLDGASLAEALERGAELGAAVVQSPELWPAGASAR